MDSWDVALLVVAGYVAVVALVRLMIHRRDQMAKEFRRRMEEQQRRKQDAEQRQEQSGRQQAA